MPDRRRIDCHLHYYPSAVGEQVLAQAVAVRRDTGGRSAWTSLPAHLALMDDADVETGIVVQQGGLLEWLRGLGGTLNDVVLACVAGASSACAAAGPPASAASTSGKHARRSPALIG